MHPNIALDEFEDERPLPTFYTQFEPWMSFNMNDLDLHFTYCSKSQ